MHTFIYIDYTIIFNVSILEWSFTNTSTIVNLSLSETSEAANWQIGKYFRAHRVNKNFSLSQRYIGTEETFLRIILQMMLIVSTISKQLLSYLWVSFF